MTNRTEYYKGRTIDPTKPVKVYKNLHKNTMSIQQDGKVVCHADSVNLINVTFKVSESGRQRVIKEKRKNVHAFVTGYVTGFDSIDQFTGQAISYNPYKAGHFYYKDNEHPVKPTKEQSVCCSIKGVLLVN